jgi:hypothetical protein
MQEVEPKATHSCSDGQGLLVDAFELSLEAIESRFVNADENGSLAQAVRRITQAKNRLAATEPRTD